MKQLLKLWAQALISCERSHWESEIREKLINCCNISKIQSIFLFIINQAQQLQKIALNYLIIWILDRMPFKFITRSSLFQSRTCLKLAETRSFASNFGPNRSNLSILQTISRKSIRPQQRFQSYQTPKAKEKKPFIVSLTYFKLFNFIQKIISLY